MTRPRKKLIDDPLQRKPDFEVTIVNSDSSELIQWAELPH